MRTRLLFLLVATLLAVGYMPARAQHPTKVPRIGYIGGVDVRAHVFDAFRQGLRELGYVEGQNIVIEHRPYNGGLQLDNTAAELVRINVDAIVAQSPDSIRAAMQATKTIPIVMSIPGNPAAIDLVESLERPGGNVTGVSGVTAELGGKWLELIKETVPSVKRIAGFWNQRAESKLPIWKSVEIAARSLKVDLRWLEVGRRPEGAFFWGSKYQGTDMTRGFRSAIWGDADAFIVLPGFGSYGNMIELIDLAKKHQLPGIFWASSLAEMGGLMSYGANSVEQSRRAAYVLDKILKGAKPSGLPVERPTQFELVINLKTAREIGVTIHPEVLMWADRVIK